MSNSYFILLAFHTLIQCHRISRESLPFRGEGGFRLIQESMVIGQNEIFMMTFCLSGSFTVFIRMFVNGRCLVLSIQAVRLTGIV